MTIAAEEFEILVLGATPAGISAAIVAARLGRRVVLVEEHQHVGGMSASGLGKSDVETPQAIGGLFLEFVDRIRQHYSDTYSPNSPQVQQCRDGYYYEPSVAEAVFREMLAEESGIALYVGQRLVDVEADGRTAKAATFVDLATETQRKIRAEVLIDATYEGDLAAAAGAEYRLGRESRDEFGEPHAGVIFLDHETHEILPGSTGAADDRLPAYTYRFCLTDDPANSGPMDSPPPGYDRENYLGYLDDLAAGRLSAPSTFHEGRGYYPEHFDTLMRAFSFAEIPGRKFDVNINPRPLSFPFGDENGEYLEGDAQTRRAVCDRHRALALGLLYFVQNDDSVPAEQRAMARRYHLPLDEFTDNGHFPWQLYVREGRRIIGEYTLTEHDVTGQADSARPTIHADSIAAGEFPIDSFPTQKRLPACDRVLEGYLSMLEHITRPYQIPYRIMVPKQVDGLLVPVAASTTHVAFSTIRMEPCWMALGQAAGAAAHLAIENGVAPRDVPIDRLQQLLLELGQVITYFDDLADTADARAAMQFFGAKGFFPEYAANPNELVSAEDATQWKRWVSEQYGATVPENGHGELTRAELCAGLYRHVWQSAQQIEIHDGGADHVRRLGEPTRTSPRRVAQPKR